MAADDKKRMRVVPLHPAMVEPGFRWFLSPRGVFGTTGAPAGFRRSTAPVPGTFSMPDTSRSGPETVQAVPLGRSGEDDQS